MQELPLNGRNVLNLIAVAPTVVPQGSSDGSLTGKNVFAAGNYQIGGGVANQSASLYDGVSLCRTCLCGNIVALTPSPEAVEEFRVQTNNSSAEFGRFTGGVVNMVSRSGSNSFHGTVFEYHRNKALNSNTFFGKRAGLDKPPFVQNNFGGVLGGPVLRNKLFFFSSYEGTQSRRRAVPAHGADRGHESRRFLRLPQCDQWRLGAYLRPWTQCGITIPALVVTTATAARCRIVCSSPATSFGQSNQPHRATISGFPVYAEPTVPGRWRTENWKKMARSAATTIRSASAATTT